MSTNPFAPEPAQALNPWARDAAEQRYPALGVSAPSPVQGQYTGYPSNPQSQQQQLQPQMTTGYNSASPAPSPYLQQQQPVQTGYYGQQPQQQPMQTGYAQQQSGYNTPSQGRPAGGGFHPSTSFGQQLQSEVNMYAGVKDLDPYSNIPNTWSQASSSSTAPPPQSQQPAGGAGSKEWGAHPRTILEHSKAALEAWDPSAWAALNRRIDALIAAWTDRRAAVLSALENQRGRALQFDEQQRVDQLLKDADEKVDSLTAGKFQIQEVESGYRHSSDASSRARVRQALNDVVRSWPDWPEELYTGPVDAPYSQQQQQQQPQMMPQQQPQFQQQQQQPMYTGMAYNSNNGLPQSQQMGMMPPQQTGMSMQPQQTGFAPMGYGMPQQQQYGYGQQQGWM